MVVVAGFGVNRMVVSLSLKIKDETGVVIPSIWVGKLKYQIGESY